MGKLRLDVDALVVDSFDTQRFSGRGTVEGNAVTNDTCGIEAQCGSEDTACCTLMSRCCTNYGTACQACWDSHLETCPVYCGGAESTGPTPCCTEPQTVCAWPC